MTGIASARDIENLLAYTTPELVTRRALTAYQIAIACGGPPPSLRSVARSSVSPTAFYRGMPALSLQQYKTVIAQTGLALGALSLVETTKLKKRK